MVMHLPDSCINSTLLHTGNETHYKWLEEQCLTHPWTNWWEGSTERTPGVLPNNNTIESFWKDMKTFMMEGTRVGHYKLLHEVFPVPCVITC